MTLPKSKQPSEENKSYICLKAAVTDYLMLVEFKFFANTAKVLNKFLVAYQTEKPIVPFLAQSIEDILHSFSSVFLLKDTLNKANRCLHLSKLYFKDRAIQKHWQDVDPGISVKLKIADLKKNGRANDNQILKFKRDIVSFLSTFCAHLAEKSPVKFSLIRNSRCFIPSLFVESPDVSEIRFNRLLENMVSTRQLPESYAEEAKQEFPKFPSMVK